MKLQKQSQTITLFAGISFVIEEFNNCGLSGLTNNVLGIRNLSGHQKTSITILSPKCPPDAGRFFVVISECKGIL
jgi:hypothetical protein